MYLNDKINLIKNTFYNTLDNEVKAKIDEIQSRQDNELSLDNDYLDACIKEHNKYSLTNLLYGLSSSALMTSLIFLGLMSGEYSISLLGGLGLLPGLIHVIEGLKSYSLIKQSI